MKKTTKDKVKEAKKTAEKIEKKQNKASSEKRLKELEDLVILMEKRINSFDSRMDTIEITHKRIKTRMGV